MLGGPRLDPIEQCGADPAPTVLGMDDSPRPDDVRFIKPDLPIRDDRSVIVGHDPCIGSEIEVRPAPNLAHEVRVDGGFHAVSRLIGEEQFGDSIQIILGRRSKLESVGNAQCSRAYVVRIFQNESFFTTLPSRNVHRSQPRISIRCPSVVVPDKVHSDAPRSPSTKC